MNAQDIFMRSIRNIFFAVVVTALAMPIVLAVPGLSGAILNAINAIVSGPGQE